MNIVRLFRDLWICHRRPGQVRPFISGAFVSGRRSGLPLPRLSPSLTAHKGSIPPLHTDSGAPRLASLRHMAGACSLGAKNRGRLFECSPTGKEAPTPSTQRRCCSFEFVCIPSNGCLLSTLFLKVRSEDGGKPTEIY